MLYEPVYLSMSGRSIVIYEECHLKKSENNHATHQGFLNQLKKLLPQSVRPIIVTDAGFRVPWFQHILDPGWDFVGRLRNKNLVLLDTSPTGEFSHTFFCKLQQNLGILTEKGKVPSNFIVYKGASKNRHKLNKNKKTVALEKANCIQGPIKNRGLLSHLFI
ncbi:transposase [Legionella antarctica]|nr:transposase [Legionella antarctica]